MLSLIHSSAKYESDAFLFLNIFIIVNQVKIRMVISWNHVDLDYITDVIGPSWHLFLFQICRSNDEKNEKYF